MIMSMSSIAKFKLFLDSKWALIEVLNTGNYAGYCYYQVLYEVWVYVGKNN